MLLSLCKIVNTLFPQENFSQAKHELIAGALRFCASLVIIVPLLLIAPNGGRYSLDRLWNNLRIGFPAVGKSHAGEEILPPEVRLLKRGLIEVGATNFTLIGEMGKDSLLRQRSREFTYPILLQSQGASFLAGDTEAVFRSGAKVIWDKQGVSIGVVSK